LTGMNEIIPYDMKLESFGDNLLNKFAKSIEEYYWTKRLGMIISQFVWLGYNHCGGAFEMVRPMSKINACISYVDEVVEADVLLENGFEMSPCELVGTRC